MSQQVWFDPFTSEASEHGCQCCGLQVLSCYVVQFCILPTKLVRKRHRDQAPRVIICRSCYETRDCVPFLIDGERRVLPTKGMNIERLGSVPCRHCGTPAVTMFDRKLYGMITSSLWMSGSCIESMPLATFCSECVENRRITLLAGI